MTRHQNISPTEYLSKAVSRFFCIARPVYHDVSDVCGDVVRTLGGTGGATADRGAGGAGAGAGP
jgi:hypothetical protein